MNFTLTFKSPVEHTNPRCCLVLQANTPPNNVYLSSIVVFPGPAAFVWPTTSGNCYVTVKPDTNVT